MQETGARASTTSPGRGTRRRRLCHPHRSAQCAASSPLTHCRPLVPRKSTCLLSVYPVTGSMKHLEKKPQRPPRGLAPLSHTVTVGKPLDFASGFTVPLRAVLRTNAAVKSTRTAAAERCLLRAKATRSVALPEHSHQLRLHRADIEKKRCSDQHGGQLQPRHFRGRLHHSSLARVRDYTLTTNSLTHLSQECSNHLERRLEDIHAPCLARRPSLGTTQQSLFQSRSRSQQWHERASPS